MTVSQPANDVGNILTGTNTTTLNAPTVDFTANINMAIRVFATPGIDITLMARETTSIGGTNDFILNTTTIPDLADTIFSDCGADSSQPLVYHNCVVLSQISISANSTMQFFIKKSSGTAFISRYEHNFGFANANATGLNSTFNDATDIILSDVVRYFYADTNANSAICTYTYL